MPEPLVFTAKVEKAPSASGWHFVRLPEDVLTGLRESSGRNGNVPVIVTIGKTTYPTTTMSMGSQQWFFAIKAEIRKVEAIAEGDTVKVRITPDSKRLNKEKL